MNTKHALMASALFTALALVLGAGVGLASGPWLSLSSYGGPPGSTVNVSGYGFSQNDGVTVSLAGGSAGHATADQNGAFTNASVTVPQKPPGVYTMLATGDHRDQAQANFYISGYYPNASPSAWYLLPGQSLSISGTGFAPGETVTLSDPQDGVQVSATADGSGAFSKSVLTVPFSWQNSTRTFTVAGGTSGASIPLTVTIGTFYPQANPSTYWVGTGQGMSVSGTGFAPSESVSLLINGAAAATAPADNSGAVNFSFTTPSQGGSFTLTLQGASTGLSSSRTIYLHS
jgi:hypothetical protein